jgi:hypothetical protein
MGGGGEGWGVLEILKLFIMKNLLHSLLTSYLLGKVSLSLPCSFLNFRKQVSNPYKTTENFISVI